MSKKNLKKIEEIVQDIFNDKNIKIQPQDMISNLKEWDSFKHISFMAAVQDEFGISLSVSEITSIKSFEELLSKIQEEKR